MPDRQGEDRILRGAWEIGQYAQIYDENGKVSYSRAWYFCKKLARAGLIAQVGNQYTARTSRLNQILNGEISLRK
jgi:hypothetical protein